MPIPSLSLAAGLGSALGCMRVPCRSSAGGRRAAQVAMPSCEAVGGLSLLDARQDVLIPSRTPAVGSQPCGEHASVSLPDAGAGKASGVFGCSLLSLSLSPGSAIVVSILYKATKDTITHGRTDTCTRVNRVTDIHKTCTLHTHMRHMDTVV